MKEGVEWRVNQQDGRVYFNSEVKDKCEIPSIPMINMTLDYATELNRII